MRTSKVDLCPIELSYISSRLGLILLDNSQSTNSQRKEVYPRWNRHDSELVDLTL